jgi:hypothetical protein
MSVMYGDPSCSTYPREGTDMRGGGYLMRLWAVSVRGPSMVPTLRHGDALVAWRRARIRPGDIVIARFPSRPDIGLVVKRADYEVPGGWWIASNNAYVEGDSRSFGTAVVEARVIFRYWPRPRFFPRGGTRLQP